MRALAMTLPAERRLLRKDGLHRCFSLQGSSGVERVAKQLLPSHFASAPTLERWLGLVERNANLRLPGCSQIEDWGVQGDGAFMVSCGRVGVPLTALLDRVRAGDAHHWAEIVAYVGIAVLEVLEHAQQVDPALAHLDLDPDNITVRPDGSLVLSEFGLWNALVPADIARGRFDSGRVHYCSPELVQSRVADARSDIFSVGVLLYRMVSGALPFTGATQLLIAMAIAEGQRSVLRSKAPEATADLCEVIEVMLATSQDERFQAPAAARSALLSTLRTDSEHLALSLAQLAEPAAAADMASELLAPPSHVGLQQAGAPSRAEATRLSIAVRPAPQAEAPQGAPRAIGSHAPPPPVLVASGPSNAGSTSAPDSFRSSSSEPQPPPLFLAHAETRRPSYGSEAGAQAVRVSQPAVLVAPELAAPGPLRANDGRTSHLKLPPSGLSRPLVEIAPLPPSPPLASPSQEGFTPPSLRLPELSSPAAALRPPDSRGAQQPGVLTRDESWAAPKSSGRWRDPSDTVFQMKRRSADTPEKEGKSSLVGVLLVSTFFGFIAVVGLYLVYRLL